jgi:tRNA threonylcarbamoyladenosine biosynthesis protein TsaB
MNILAIDTATETLGLCLQMGSQKRVYTLQIGLKHAQSLVPTVAQMFSDFELSADALDLVVCALGPGSFTGLRIGLSTAKGLAMGAGCALIGVSGLNGLAYRYTELDSLVVPMLPGLRNKYYLALYEHGQRISDYLDLPLSELPSQLAKYDRIFLTGPQSDTVYRYLIQELEGLNLSWDRACPFTDPQGILEAGKLKFVKNGSDQELTPLYLRKSEAEIKLYAEQPTSDE